MKQVTHIELDRLITHTSESKISLMIHGKMGIGKSQVVRQAAIRSAKDKNKRFIEWNNTTQDEKRELLEDPKDTFIFADIRVSLQEPTDLKGLPNYYDGIIEWKPHILFKILENKEADGILFFDELLNAPTSVQMACYQIIQDRAIGEISLNDKIGIVCAGNLSEEVNSIFDMPEPLRNRMIHVELKLDHEVWEKWAFKNQINSDIISYLHWKPSRLYTFNRKDKTFSFATPRSWTMASRLIENYQDKEILISSSVGEGIAVEFMAFLGLKDELDIDDLLINPEKIKNIEKVDKKYALIGALADRYKRDRKIFGNCIEICKNLDPEFAILLLRNLILIISASMSQEEAIIEFNKELKRVKGENYFLKYFKYFQ